MKKKPLIEYTTFHLDNGLKCVLYKRSEIHSVSIAVKIHVGGLNEDQSTSGISHLLEHLPFDGTQKFKSWDEIDSFNNSIAGDGNAYTSSSNTRFYGSFPSQFLEQAIEYYSQLVFHPLLKESDVEKERQIVLDEMKRSNDMVGTKIYQNMIQNRYIDKKTPFSHNVIGTRENVSIFTRDEIFEHHEKFYVPSNMEIYIVGNFDEGEAKKFLNKYFDKDLKRNFGEKPEARYFKDFPDYSSFSVNAIKKNDVDQYYLSMTFPTFEKINTKNWIFDGGVPFVERILASAQYQKSILWKRLREELGLVYGVDTYTLDYTSRAMFVIETAFQPEHLKTILSEIYSGVNSLKQKAITDEVFKTRQKYLLNTHLMFLDTPQNVINWIEDIEETKSLTGESQSVEEFMEMIERYTFDEVIDISNKILDWSKVNIGIVSKDDKSELEEKTAKIWSDIIG